MVDISEPIITSWIARTVTRRDPPQALLNLAAASGLASHHQSRADLQHRSMESTMRLNAGKFGFVADDFSDATVILALRAWVYQKLLNPADARAHEPRISFSDLSDSGYVGTGP